MNLTPHPMPLYHYTLTPQEPEDTMTKEIVPTTKNMNYYKKQLLDRLIAEADASRDVVKAIVTTAKLLHRMKKDVGHGSWMKVFEDEEVAALGFSHDKAKKYMVITGNEFLMDPKNWEYLPPSYSSLAILSGVNPKKLNKLLNNGGLDHTLTVTEARHLLASSTKPKEIEHKKGSKEDDDEEVASATKPAKKSGKDILAGFAESLENLQEQLDDFDLKDFEAALSKFFDKYAKENG